MKILVAGGAGYIGSHTVQALLDKGFQVVTLDNFSTGKREMIPGGEVVEGDLMKPRDLSRLFRTYDIKAVLHFASLIQVGESYINPQKYYRSNLISSLNLLEAMLKAEVKLFIFSSSAAVYGIPDTIPIPESHPKKPVNPYGRTKLMVEQILEDYDHAYGLKYISLRYFNAAGADREGRMGEMHDPETHLIPNILLSLLHRNKTLEIYGTDFPTSDGTAVRDYIHVSDLADAHVLALERILADPQSLCLNLGSNRGFSVKEIVDHVEKVTGKRVSRTCKPRRKGDPPVLLASNRKAREILKWELKQSDIHNIIRTAWNWHARTNKKFGSLT